MADTINIGEKIHEELVKQGRTVAWLSRELGTSRTTCYRIFDCYSIDTQLLYRISILLKYNFFKYYSQAYTEDEELLS